MMPKIIEWVDEETLVNNKKYTLYPYNSECEADAKHIDVLVQELVNNKYIICGDTHQHKAIPVFNDGYLLMSMRSWAEVMAASVYYSFPTHARKQYWNYRDFYMACNCPGSERLPKKDEEHNIL